MRKSLNLVLFFLAGLLAIGVVWNVPLEWEKKISLEVLDLFPQGPEREWVNLHRQFGDSKVIYVSQKDAKDFEGFLNQVLSLPNVATILRGIKPNAAFEEFLRENYFYSGNFTPSTLSTEEISAQLLKEANSQDFNPYDPLKLISIPNFSKDFILDGQAYVVIEMKSSQAQRVHALYERFVPLAQEYGIEHYFSPLFMSVENPQLILHEVNVLMGVAGAFFILLYFVILRIPFLTLNMIATLLLSNLCAISALFLFYPQVSIMSLSFGIGISNICIDYMMHHHFLGFYQRKSWSFNLAVFYGFITTLVGFFVCLFIPFPLLNQLSLYAMINLSVAYFCFAFIYPNIGFAPPKFYEKIETLSFNVIPSIWFILLSICMASVVFVKIRADFDLSKLDYQNKEMNAQKEFFAPLQKEEKPFLIYASSIDALIAKAKEVSSHLSSPLALSILPTKSEIRKRERYFKSMAFFDFTQRYNNALYSIDKVSPALVQYLSLAYKIPKFQGELTLEELSAMGFTLLKEKGKYYYQSYTSELEKLEHLSGVNIAQTQDLIKEITQSIYAPMVSILVLALVAMVILLAISTRHEFFNALPFILFPCTSVMFYLSLSKAVNIMHLFALLLVVVVGVDYGIYHTREGRVYGARSAILFSTLTTLFSFGLFLFSQTQALRSFGEVICLGMGCLLILIFFQKDRQ